MIAARHLRRLVGKDSPIRESIIQRRSLKKRRLGEVGRSRRSITQELAWEVPVDLTHMFSCIFVIRLVIGAFQMGWEPMMFCDVDRCVNWFLTLQEASVLDD
jgi:hypothetical protein